MLTVPWQEVATFHMHSECYRFFFLFTGFAWSEVAILRVMTYDRYVAVCLPLHWGHYVSQKVYMSCDSCMAKHWHSRNLVYSNPILDQIL